MGGSLDAMIKMMIRTRLFLWLFVFCGVFFFGAFCVVVPGKQRLLRRQIQLNEIKFKVDTAEKASRNLKNLDSLLQKVRDEREHLNGMTLKPGEQARAISLLTEAAQRLGISILSIQPVPLPPAPSGPDEKEEKKDTHKLKPLLLTTELGGRYQSLGALFEGLKKAPLVLTVEEFQMNLDPAFPGS